VLVAAGWGVFLSASALAASQGATHVFGFAFASKGAGEGQLSEPDGIAVSEVGEYSGDVYVVDRANNRIERFSPEVGAGAQPTGYKFVSAWGFDVRPGGKGGSEAEYEVCNAGEGCQAGTPPPGKGVEKLKLRPGQLIAPTQVAVDNSTDLEDPSRGDVYVVADMAEEHGTVFKFGPEGRLIARVTKRAEEEEYESAVSVAVDAKGTVWVAWSESNEVTLYSHAEIPKREPEAVLLAFPQLQQPRGQLALDSHDDLYTAYEEPEVFETAVETDLEKAKELEFEAEELEAEAKKLEAEEEAKRLELEREAKELREKAQELKAEAKTPAQEKLRQYAEEGRSPEGGNPCEHARCLAAKLLGVENPGNKLGPGESELKPGEPLIGEFDPHERTSGVAVDPSATNSPGDDVYLDNVSGVTALTPEGTVLESFPSRGEERAHGGPILQNGAGIALDGQNGAVYVADAGADRIDVFTSQEAGPPTVEGLVAREVGGESARLQATIDPRGARESTSWYVEYGTAPCPNGCTRVPGGQLGGAETVGAQEVAVSLGTGTSFALSPGTTYYYRFVAENAEHGQGTAADSFATPSPSGKFVADERTWEMVSPVEKGSGQVEPITKYGGAIQAAANGQAITYVTDAPVGEAHGSRSFEVTQTLSCSVRVSTCASAGAGPWVSRDIVTPNEHGVGINPEIYAPEYQLFSEDLALALVQPVFGLGRVAEPPLSPPVTQSEAEKGQENTVYLRADSAIAPQAEAEGASYQQALANGAAMGMHGEGFLALVDEANVLPGAKFGSYVGSGGMEEEPALSVLGGTPDFSTIVLGSTVALTSESEATPEPGSQDLYTLSNGKLRLINTLPAGRGVASDAKLGEADQNVRHAISDDGTRVFWSTGGHLYMRDTGNETTVQLDGTSETEPGGAVFQTASADGSRVFFTDTQRLTTDSGASEERPDLYVCQIREGETTHELEPCSEGDGALVDLTPVRETSAHERESAAVQGTVLGASKDGSYVYFVANGVLSDRHNAEGAWATPGACESAKVEPPPPPGTTCNLYVDRYNSASGLWGTSFIASLSAGDAPDWEATHEEHPGPGELAEVTSRVSPNGRFLAFMSDQSLTRFEGQPYDNAATAQGANDAPAEEVYEYAAPDAEAEPTEAGRLVCASCNPSGSRPTGLFDPLPGTITEEGHGLLVDRPEVWTGRWLAASVPGWTRLHPGGSGDPPWVLYQSRYLSDSGRLYFDSPEKLVAQDENGREDVYEYEPEGVPQGRHACASSSGTYDPRGGGCLGLISSGTSDRESAFLDASETGGEGEHGEQLDEGGSDVFFVTAAPLVPQDTDDVFDVYDAHECLSASPCALPFEEKTPQGCKSTEECAPYAPSPVASLGTPASAPPGAVGNLAPHHGVLPSKTSKPKPPTRAQELAAGLRACRAKHKRSRKRRVACERQARKRYGSGHTRKKARAGKKAGKSDGRVRAGAR